MNANTYVIEYEKNSDLTAKYWERENLNLKIVHYLDLFDFNG